MNSTGKHRLFIVEDNFAYSYLVEAMLKENGSFSVTNFTTGDACIELLDNNPDVILLDYNLEGEMNGLETFKMIHAKKPKIPVIILSGQTDVQVAADLLKAGAFDYITKKDKDSVMEKIQAAVFAAINKRS